MSKRLRLCVKKNGHYSDCLLSDDKHFPGITDVNVKCWCGRPLPLGLGCARGRVYCGKCYREFCHEEEYNPEWSYCLNRRMDRHVTDLDERLNMDMDDVAECISGVPEEHFHENIVNRRRAEEQKERQCEKWREAEERAEYWKLHDPGSYHDSDPDDSIVVSWSLESLDSGSDSESDREPETATTEPYSPVRPDYSDDDNVAPADIPDLEPNVIDLTEEPPRKRRRLMKKSEIKEDNEKKD